MKHLKWFLLVFSLLLPQAAHANRAEVMILPPRVVMENADRYSTIIVRNIGNGTGDFTVGLQDMKMLESGMVVPLDPGETAPYSAISYLQITPKSMTLRPGESQNIRLMLRAPEKLEPGEYRTHVKVRLVNDNTDENDVTTAKDAVIAVKANLVIVIPVIVHHGATTLSVGIADAKLVRDNRAAPSVQMYITRTGDRSSMGDIAVTYIPQGGAPRLIKEFRGVAVYRPLPRRFISVPLDETPKSMKLAGGTLDVVYAAQARDGGGTLAETKIPVMP